MLLKMSWRTIWRHKRRSLITGSSIGFGVWLALITSGAANYTYSAMIDNSASLGFGHVTILPTGYLETPSMEKAVDAAGTITDRALAMTGVKSAYPRIMAQAMVATATASTSAQLMGIDPAREAPESNLLIDSIVKGDLFEPDDRSAVIGASMAKRLHLDVGKKLVYTTTDKNGDMVSQLARVSGIFRTGAEEIDGHTILLPLEVFRKAVGYGRDEASFVAVVLSDNRHTDLIRDRIEASLTSGHGAVDVQTWRQTQPDLAGFVAIDQGTSRVFVLLVALLVSLGIVNTMLMAVLERHKEFGIMLALGMGPTKLVRGVLIESLLLALIGVGLGLAITIPFHLYLVQIGLDMGAFVSEGMTAGGAVFDPVLRSVLFLEDYLSVITGVVVLTVLAALYPAIKAGRLPPVQSIRNLG